VVAWPYGAGRESVIPPGEGYGKLPVDEVVRRILEPAEERLIVEKTLEVDYTVGAYVGILGETGLRMEEGMNRTVKEWLGHKDITTTMLYLRFVEGHAEAKFREAEKAELLELAGSGDKLTRFR
jgi:hypothetical protein